MKKKEFLVYDVYYCGFLAYVGSGSLDRPDHVKSGRSHSSKLNEVYFRETVYGEPELKVRIYKYYDTKESALKAEKTRIKDKNPLFNKTNCSKGVAELFKTTDWEILKERDLQLYTTLKALCDVAYDANENVNLAFTPFGLRVPLKTLMWDTSVYDSVSLSVFGKSNKLEDSFDIVIDHNDLINIKVKPETINKVNLMLEDNVLTDFMSFKKPPNTPIAYRIGYNKSPCGKRSEVLTSCVTDNVVFAKCLNTYRGVDIISALVKVDDGKYHVICLNNKHVIFKSEEPSLALSVYHSMWLSNYEFKSVTEQGLSITMPLDLISCTDFKTGEIVKNVPQKNNVNFTPVIEDIKIKESKKGKTRLRVKYSENVANRLRDYGFKDSGKFGWVNLSTEVKAFQSCGAMSSYKRINECEFMEIDLSHYKF